MKITYDSAKNQDNIDKHGIDFEDLKCLFNDLDPHELFVRFSCKEYHKKDGSLRVELFWPMCYISEEGGLVERTFILVAHPRKPSIYVKGDIDLTKHRELRLISARHADDREVIDNETHFAKESDEGNAGAGGAV